jgi:hypothetical protein
MTGSRTRTLATVAAAGVLLAGCAPIDGSSPTPSSSGAARALTPGPYPAVRPPAATSATATSMPAPSKVNTATADAAAVAAVKAIESSDTTVDADPNATVRRASAWLTPTFAAQVTAYPPVAAPGATWNAWAAHRAYVTVTTSLGGDEHPADTATATYRQVIAVLHPLGRDGWKGPTETEVVFVSLAPVNGQWRVASEQTTSD